MNKAVRKALRYLLPAVLIGFVLNVQYAQKSLQELLALSSIKMLLPPGGYWYMVVLTIFNFSLLPLLPFRRRWATDALVAVAFYALFTLAWRKGGAVGQLFFMEHCATYYPFFIIGFMARRYGWTDYVLHHNWTFTAGLAAYAVAFTLHPSVHFMENLCLRFIVPVAGAVVLVYWFGRREQEETRVERMLQFFGRNSLNIYLLHYFFLPVVRLQPWVAWLVSTDNMLLEWCLTASLALLIATLSVYVGKFFMQSRIVRNCVYGEFANK